MKWLPYLSFLGRD